jgi:hypothetical protein
MSLQNNPIIYSSNNAIEFKDSKQFNSITKGLGIKCDICKNNHVFTNLSNWKIHCKGKKHIKLITENKVENKDNYVLKLEEELREKKILICRYSNECEKLKLNLKKIKLEMNRLKEELKYKFKLS